MTSFINIMDQLLNNNHSKKKIKLPYDVLAISIAGKRIRDEKCKVVSDFSFDNSELQLQVIHEDLNLAQKIRDFYSKKLVYWKISGKELSSFRKDLEIFIQSDPLSYSFDFNGLIYKLPYFYDYDMAIESFKQNFFSEYIDSRKVINSQYKKTHCLSPIKYLEKTNKLREYWFSDSENGAPAVITTTISSETRPFIPLWDKIFNSKMPLAINGDFFVSNNLDFNYYRIENWTIVDDKY